MEKTRRKRYNACDELKGEVKINIFCDKKNPPRSGGPKPEPSDSGSGLERSRDKMSER